METLAEELADQLSRLDPCGWFQRSAHSNGSATVILVIVLTAVFVVYHYLHAKIVKTKQTLMVRTLFTNIINKQGGTVRECLMGGFLRVVSHKSSVPYQLLPEASRTARCSQD